jgi:hypothetical protein
MKRIAFFSTFALVALAALIGVPGLRVFRTHVARAQSGCSAGTLSTPYSYNAFGSYYDDQFNFYVYSDVGVLIPDGNGGLTGSDTVSNDGTVARRTLTGSYTVNSNCTGNMKLTFSVGGAASLDFVLFNGGKGINFVDTDNLVNVTGTATAQ